MSLLDGIAGAVLLAATGAGCASSVELGPASDPVEFLRRLPPHREIQSVTISIADRKLPLVAHAAFEAAGEIRVHLGSEGGLTGMDIGIRGDRVTVYARSRLLDAGGLEVRVAGDLARVYGARSLFSTPGDAGPCRLVAGSGDVALPLPDGSWLTAPAGDLAPGSGRVRVRLLDPRRVPEAEILYEEFAPDGTPGTVTLRDLRDGHVLEIEVLEVLPRAEGPR